MPTTIAAAPSHTRRLTCWPVKRFTKRQRDHQTHRGERLHDDQGAGVEGDRLQDPATGLEGRAGQPHRADAGSGRESAGRRRSAGASRVPFC